jgi:S-methylmethionine-dependent homocysteine/selenocysteine methylase
MPLGPLLLDGATGTEIERAGVYTGLPLWSSHALLEAPETVRAIHRRYVEAGVEVLTANTFRTQRRALARAGLGDLDAELTRRAVTLARDAIRESARESPSESGLGGGDTGAPRAVTVYIAGSQPPLEDCYRADLVPDDASLESEHIRQANLLAEAGVDLILVETMCSAREARIAARAAVATGLPVVVGFVSWERDRILSGESLRDAANQVLEVGAVAVGVNCVPPASLPDALACLAPLGVPLLASPNLGEPDPETGFSPLQDVPAEGFVRHFEPWLAETTPGPSLIGGCCGTRPDHLSALAARLAHERKRRPPRPRDPG